MGEYAPIVRNSTIAAISRFRLISAAKGFASVFKHSTEGFEWMVECQGGNEVNGTRISITKGVPYVLHGLKL